MRSTAMLVLLIALSECTDTASQSSSTLEPRFFVVAATGGSDSNPGTLAQPFATLAHAQTTMRASRTVKTAYLRAGTYMLTEQLAFSSSDNGERWQTYPGDAAQAAVLTLNWNNANSFMFDIVRASDITFTNLTISGGATGGGANAGAFRLLNSENIIVTHNHFINNSAQVDITMYNSDGIYVERNTSDTNEYQFFAGKSDDGRQHNHWYITDNISTDFSGNLNDIYVFGPVADLHVDRNTVIAPRKNGSTILISVVDITSTGRCNTIDGNVLGGPNTDNLVSIEVAALAGTSVTTSVEHNVSTNAPHPFLIGQAVKVEVSNNTATTGSTAVFSKDGGWNGTEWIGGNILNGSLVSGWNWRTYGEQPPVCTPSSVAH